MTEFNQWLAAIGALILLLGLFSSMLKRKGMPVPLVALVIGILLGPAVTGIFDPARFVAQDLLLEQAARLTLGIGLMGVALRLPKGYVHKNWRSLLVVLGLGMPFMWIVTSALIYLILGFPPLIALLAGSAVTPTDPVIASAVVTGKLAEQNLPERLRNLLSGESGINDGMAFPFVLLAILLLSRPPEGVVIRWLLNVLLFQVGLAALVGAASGWAVGWLLDWGEKHGTIERGDFLAYAVALVLFILATVKLIGSDDVLAAFVAVLSFNAMIGPEDQEQQRRTALAVEPFFTFPIFSLLGFTLPWQKWFALGWPALILVLAVFLLRRLPVILAMKPLLSDLESFRDALFVGWFGPIGVSALFYASLALRETKVEQVWVVGSLLIVASVLIHGLTATPFTGWFASAGKTN